MGSPASLSGPTKDVVAGAKMLLVDTPSRPGHKKSLRAKGHRANVSIDAADCCDQSAESVALVIDCEDWSESTSSSGTDWSAGPPRWNHVFVIPNYKEVSQVDGWECVGLHDCGQWYLLLLLLLAVLLSGWAQLALQVSHSWSGMCIVYLHPPARLQRSSRSVCAAAVCSSVMYHSATAVWSITCLYNGCC
jgi:hypothetical protein